MLSRCGNGSLRREMSVYSMWTDAANISPIRRTPEAAYDYAIKDGDVVAGGLERPSRDSLASAGSKWAEIIAATTRDQFLNASRAGSSRIMHQLHQYPDVCGMEVPTQPCQYESPGGISFDTSRSQHSMNGLGVIWDETL